MLNLWQAGCLCSLPSHHRGCNDGHCFQDYCLVERVDQVQQDQKICSLLSLLDCLQISVAWTPQPAVGGGYDQIASFAEC